MIPLQREIGQTGAPIGPRRPRKALRDPEAIRRHVLAAPRPESAIQAEVVRLLRARLPIVLEMNRERVLGAGNRTAAGRRATARIGAAGIADVLAVWNGADHRAAGQRLACAAVGCPSDQTVYAHPHTRGVGTILSVEVKRPNSRTDKRRAAKQLAWRQSVHRAGGIAVEVTSPAELAQMLGWA